MRAIAERHEHASIPRRFGRHICRVIQHGAFNSGLEQGGIGVTSGKLHETAERNSLRIDARGHSIVCTWRSQRRLRIRQPFIKKHSPGIPIYRAYDLTSSFSNAKLPAGQDAPTCPGLHIFFLRTVSSKKAEADGDCSQLNSQWFRTRCKRLPDPPVCPAPAEWAS